MKNLSKCFFNKFKCCLLVWMSHNKDMNNKINRIYEKVFRIAFYDKRSLLQNLTKKVKSMTIYQRNLPVVYYQAP